MDDKENAKKIRVKELKEAIVNKLDQNMDGTIDIEDIIALGFKAPGIRVNRGKFFQTEFNLHFSEEQITSAICSNPIKAGIPLEYLDKVADDVIEASRNHVSGLSAALGAPGGLAMVATIPADIIQYYGYMLHTAQKLMYLYGFPEIDFKEDGTLDSATTNLIIICLGVMYGVAGANNAIKVLATQLGKGVEKKLLNKALTKGTVYPIVKSVSKWFNVRMTKEIFAGFFKNGIPVAGGVLGGGITFVTFKPCCIRLKDELRDTMLSNPFRMQQTDDINIIDM